VEGVVERANKSLDDLLDSGVLEQIFVGIYQDVGSDSGNAVLSELKSNPEEYSTKDATTFSLYAPDVLVFLLSLAAEKVTGITDYTKALLQSTLEEGVRGGESLIEIRKRVDKLYLEEIIPNRSWVIAATETHSAAEYGSQEAARSSGLTLKKVWLSTNDKHTRPDHVKADGQEVDMDEPFIVGGEKLLYPGDPAGSAKNIISCRCTHYYRRVKETEKVMLWLPPINRHQPSREEYRRLLKVRVDA